MVASTLPRGAYIRGAGVGRMPCAAGSRRAAGGCASFVVPVKRSSSRAEAGTDGDAFSKTVARGPTENRNQAGPVRKNHARK